LLGKNAHPNSSHYVYLLLVRDSRILQISSNDSPIRTPPTRVIILGRNISIISDKVRSRLREHIVPEQAVRIGYYDCILLTDVIWFGQPAFEYEPSVMSLKNDQKPEPVNIKLVREHRFEGVRNGMP
jgi:hypothetical protein